VRVRSGQCASAYGAAEECGAHERSAVIAPLDGGRFTMVQENSETIRQRQIPLSSAGRRTMRVQTRLRVLLAASRLSSYPHLSTTQEVDALARLGSRDLRSVTP
jgi:hypothetical protein